MDITGNTIKVNKKTVENEAYSSGSWIDVLFAMDYDGDKIDVFIDGKNISTIKDIETFTHTDRFNFLVLAGKKKDDGTTPAELYFDNMFVYYPPQSVTATVTGEPGDSSKKDEIIVDFGQNVILPSNSYVSLNGDSTVDAEPVVEHGYVTGLKIKNLSLAGGTEYTVAFPGVKDFLGNGISDYVFTTEAVVPQISIVRKNSDAVYEVGDRADFKIESAYLGGNDIVIYRNGEVYGTLSADATEFSVELVGGDNEIYAKVPDLVTSDPIEIFVDDTPTISMTKQGVDTSYSAGDSVKFNIGSANLDGNTIEIYNNGTLVDKVGADTTEVTVEIESGYNKVFAKVPALDIKTAPITILAEGMGPVGEVTFFDFEDGKTGNIQLDKYSGNITVVDSGDEHGKSLSFSHGSGTVENKPRVIVEKFTDKKGVYSFEADFKFSRVDERTAILPIIYKPSQGANGTIALYVLDNGRLLTGSKQICEVKKNVWYNFRATWNSETKKSDFYVNGEKKAADIDFSKYNDFASFLYVNIIMTHKAGETSSMYMDNIKSCFLAEMANAELSVGSDASEVPYENTAITLEFDQTMNPDSLKGVKLTSEIGKEILVDFASANNRTFTANVASLSPNTNYSIDLSKVKAEAGVGVSAAAVSFKTQKAPLAIKSVKTAVAGRALNVEVSIQNNNGEEKSYIVIAAVYTGNMMLSSDAKAYESSTPEKDTLTLTKPNGDYELEIYVFDSAISLNLIDKLIVK